MLTIAFIALAFSFGAVALLVRLGAAHETRYPASAPQRFHVGNVPRLGGAAMFAATAAAWLAAGELQRLGIRLNIPVTRDEVLAWLVVIAPGVIGGCVEDITHRLRVGWRLGLTALSALLAVGWLGLRVSSLDIQPLDAFLVNWPAFGVLLAFVGVMGLPHAFNLIDGYNGLAATVAIVICMALAHVALQVGDRQLAMMVISLAAATGGFWLWNYPKGLIFAGDSGAYLWGAAIALASLTLVQRHGQVSPWFPMLVLIYPVLETLFSIYRKAARGISPSVADALHFHQLIYRRIVRGVFHGDEARRMLRRNNRTSPYLWGFTVMTVMPAVLFWNNTPVLMAFCALFVLAYLWSYLMIIRFKVPPWLRR